MAKGSKLRDFLLDKVENLKHNIHVRRLLLTRDLKGAFTVDERTMIENEYSETRKCELFLEAILRKDDHIVETFFKALQEKQPKLQVLKEWQIYQFDSNHDNQSSSTKEPMESEDYSQVEVKDFYYASQVSHENNDPGNYESNNLNTCPNRNIEGECEKESSMVTKVIHCLSQHAEISEKDREDIGLAVKEEDMMRDVNQRLVDIIVRLVRRQQISPYVIKDALEKMDLSNLAASLIQQTVHDKYLHQLNIETWTRLTQELSIQTYNTQGDTWKRLPEVLGISNEVHIDYIAQYAKCPAEEILNIWKMKRNATVCNLYEKLMSIDASTAASILEPHLPVVMETSDRKDFSRSPSVCSSISDNEQIAKSLNL